MSTSDLPVAVAPRSLTDENQQGAGLMRLAMLSPAEFKMQLDTMKLGLSRLRDMQRDLMTEGEDYGVIPGTKKPTLLKPGAEKLGFFFRLVPTFSVERTYGDGVMTPPIGYVVTATLHLGDETGPAIGQGVGACNSWERKYRYRVAQRQCPACGVSGAIIRTKRNTPQDGYWCAPNKGGCGENIALNNPAMTVTLGQVDNPDPHDLENTLLKMAKKRAYIDATLTATASSDLFTQDMEDTQGDNTEAPAKPVEAKPETKAKPKSEARVVPDERDPAVLAAWQELGSAIRAAGYGPTSESEDARESFANWRLHSIVEHAMMRDLTQTDLAALSVEEIKTCTAYARSWLQTKPAGPRPMEVAS